MQIFTSYARPDKVRATALAGRLTQLGHQVWLDERLTGGQDWWGRILHQIRESDAVVLLVSPAALRSQACDYERGYATALGKTVLPVLVEPLPHEVLPPDLARVQFVDYIQPGEDSAIRLAGAVAGLRRAGELPDPLPEPPPVPLSYLSHLGQRLSADVLSLEDQLDIVARLETALRASDEEEREAGSTLLRSMSDRRDLYAETARRLERLVGSPDQSRQHRPVGQLSGQGPVAPPPASVPAAASASPDGVAQPAVDGPDPANQATAGTSKGVKVLAWIGGFFVLLFVLALCDAMSSQQCVDTFGQVVPC